MNNDESFVEKNKFGFIFTIIAVVIVDIAAFSYLEYGHRFFLFLNLFIIPLVFLAWVIGNAIRRAVRPDVIFTSGFWGLVKEKIFWRIGPQLILSMIVLAILVNTAEGIINFFPNYNKGDNITLLAEYEEYVDEIVYTINSNFDLETQEIKYYEIREKIVPLLVELHKRRRFMTEEEELELIRITNKLDAIEWD